MLVRKEVGYFFLVVIAIVSIAASVGAAWLYVNLAPMLEDRSLQVEMTRLHAASKLYYSKLESFRGVCGDIGIHPGYDCNAADDNFAVSVERPDGSFYCVDKEDGMNVQILPIRDMNYCSRISPDDR